MSGPTLYVQLDAELPSEVAVGRGTAVFVCGWCFCPHAPLRELRLLVDGAPQPLLGSREPRLDPFRALHPGIDDAGLAALDADPDSELDPQLLGYRTGFWGLAEIGPRAGEEPVRLALEGDLRGGGSVQAPLGSLAVRAGRRPLELPVGLPTEEGPLVAVCLAAYNPPADLLTRQLDSIRAQTHRNWVCVISDDCSGPAGRATIDQAVGGDPRFIVSRSRRRLGFYRNFERALELAPRAAGFLALADQDDSWHPDKLSTLLGAIGDAELVYSDARVVSRDGNVLSPTWWSTRTPNHRDPLSLLVANAVTGAASLLRRELLSDALPFPPAQFAHFHDHWLGLVARARGRIEYVARPLYDYVQHGGASLGHERANRIVSVAERLRSRRPLADRVRVWRLHYFADVCRLLQFCAVLRLRCGARMTRRQRGALEILAQGSVSPLAFSRLLLRGARELLGRRETLGAEWMLAHAVAWRAALELTASDRPRGRLRLDALPPPSLVMEPGREIAPAPAREVADKIAPLRWSIDTDQPPRINLLIPSIDLQHLFGGYIAKFNLARRLAEHGASVRIVTVDPQGPLPAGWRGLLERYSGLAGLFDRVEVAFGREAGELMVSPRDAFLATTWWTAHIANHAVELLERPRFLYLIQEYEPFTFPMGTLSALARQSYTFPHAALFSSEFLRSWFRRHGLGVYRAGPDAGDTVSAAFENAITPIAPPAASALAARRTRRLLFYARPEPHAARNLYELGLLGLGRAAETGCFADGWELRGTGTVGRARRIGLGGGAELELLPRRDQAGYAELLPEHDLGLALMDTPHPSLVPLEMAAAGLVTVTTTFENKTAEALAAISGNLLAVEPTVDAVADALCKAVARVDDVERRIAGSDVRWSREWDQSLPESLLESLLGWLEVDGFPAGAQRAM